MARMNIYKLWCQDQAFLEYYTVFMIVFLVDTLELPRQLPNWERFYWPTYKDDVEDWIRRCVTCVGTKGRQTRLSGKSQKYNAGYPFERILIDLAGQFPTPRRGNRHILVVADYFSKWCEAYPAPTINVPEIAKVFVENWISHYGEPTRVAHRPRK